MLQVENLDPAKNFFEAGGDSMSMVHMLVAVTAHFDCEFDYEAFVREPTLDRLATLVVDAHRA